MSPAPGPAQHAPHDADETPGAVLTIDLDAVVANYRLIEDRVRPAKVAGVVKADGYGLGAAPIARTLSRAGCGTFFVAHVDEGIRLREEIPIADIYVLHGFDSHWSREFAKANLMPVLNSLDQIDAWLDCEMSQPCAVHLDTGMSRLGLSHVELAELLKDQARVRQLKMDLVMSHLGNADDADHPRNREQLDRFEAVHHRFGRVAASLCNSAGCFLGSDFVFDLVRPGIALYGANPRKDGPNPMKAVATLTAPLLQVRNIDRGESVGYGATYTASGPRRLGVAAFGYADGLLRALGNRGHGVVAGVKCPIVGRVSMDLVTLDVTAAPEREVYPGARVEFLGPNQTIDELARNAGTLPYEVFTRLGPRIARRYVGAGAQP